MKFECWMDERYTHKFTSHHAWGTNGVYMWMHDGCKAYMGSHVASNGSCFMATLTILENHLLEVTKPNTKPRDPSTPKSHNHWFILFHHALGPRMNKNSLKYHSVEGVITLWLHTTLEGPWPHYMILEVSWDVLCTLFPFGLSQFHGHGSWHVFEVALILFPVRIEDRQLIEKQLKFRTLDIYYGLAFGHGCHKFRKCMLCYNCQITIRWQTSTYILFRLPFFPFNFFIYYRLLSTLVLQTGWWLYFFFIWVQSKCVNTKMLTPWPLIGGVRIG